MTTAVDIPRSILKKSTTPPLSVSVSPRNHPPEHHAVHFPPSPCVTRTYETHSSSIYDRSPIVVGPNNCALPARGCPGRTYYKVEEEEEEDEIQFCTRFLRLAETRESKRGHAHPRALELINDSDIPSVPLLIPDLTTSESEESDGFISPAPESVTSVPFKPSLSHDNCTALFPPEPLAHPALLPSFTISERVTTITVESKSYPVPCPRPRVRRSRSSSPPSDDIDEDSGYVEDSEHADEERTPTGTRRFSLSPPRQPVSTSPPKKKKGCKVAALRSHLCKNLSFRSDEDNSCLGGF